MSDSQLTQEYEPAVIDAVKKQIEYYFSKENLQTDVYLQSQMDAQMSVSLSVVMKFAKLKALTTDEALVRRALNDSTIVSVVDNRLKANIKSSGRSTIILREIPSDASENEVKEIFNYEGCKNILSIRSDIGDTWFVVMETEEDAKDTALDLRLKRRTFRGQPVKARIKTENVVRSYYPVAPVVAPVQPVFPILPYPPVAPIGIDMVPYGFMPPVAPISGGTPSTVAAATNNSPSNEAVVDTVESSTEEVATKEEVVEASSKSTGATARPREARKPARPAGREPEGRRKPEPRKSSGGAPAAQPSKEKEKKVDPVVSKPPIEINSMTFPPLNTVDDTPIPTPGYKGDYIKYTFDGIITIVKEVKEANLPSDLQAGDHPLAMTATPNLDLLKRQRTFSIDETREQLRQGRPVQREAIISGAVDYRSLMYGDDSHGDHAQKHAKAKSIEVPSSSGSTVSAPVIAEVAKVVEETLHITEPKSSKTESESVAAPSSPQKISAATWAAMVKSSAAATVETTTAQSPAVKTFPVMKASNAESTKKQVKTSSDKTQPSASGNPRKSTDGSKEKGADKEKKSSRGDKKKPKEGDEKKAITEETTAVAVGSDNTESAQGASTAWGGKASFANIVKSKLAEDGAAEEAPKPVVRRAAPSTESSAHKPLKQNERANGIRDSGNGRDRDRNRERSHREKDMKEKEPREKDNSKKPVEENSVEIFPTEEK